MSKKLGKIERVKFGIGGYQDSMLGLSVKLMGQGWGVDDFKGFWDSEKMERTESCQWTEEDRDEAFAGTTRFISKLLNEAKVDSVDNLRGIPVEVTIEGGLLKEWRILKEVL